MHSLEILLVIYAPAHYVLILLSITLATLKVYAVVLMLKNKNVLSLTGFTKIVPNHTFGNSGITNLKY